VAPPRLLILDPRVGALIYMGGCSKYFLFQNPKGPMIAWLKVKIFGNFLS